VNLKGEREMRSLEHFFHTVANFQFKKAGVSDWARGTVDFIDFWHSPSCRRGLLFGLKTGGNALAKTMLRKPLKTVFSG
jgi:hypothetical protein